MPYRDTSYRMAFGIAPRAPSRQFDDEFVIAFERLMTAIAPLVQDVPLVQRGLREDATFRGIRQVRRKPGRDLTAFRSAADDASRVDLIVMDQRMTRTEPPAFHSWLTWAPDGEIDGVPVSSLSAEAFRFWIVAIATDLLRADTDKDMFDRAAASLHSTIGGWKGGVLRSEPWYFRGLAGLAGPEGAPRNVAISILQADVATIEDWEPDVDVAFQ
jgi:hypothetical protein